MKFYHVSGPAPLYTNTFVLISQAGHAVVIDPAAEAESYNKILRENNATLIYIFCTHGHFDHVGAAQQLRSQWGATLYCEKSDLRGNQLYPMTESDSGYPEGVPIQLDELTFTAWHTPGHTPGGVCILCGQLFFTGDTLFAGGAGRTDLEGGSYATLLASGNKIMHLPIPEDAVVLPGHEGTSTYGEEMKSNYFISMCRSDGSLDEDFY